jgi:hypothetical protein
LKINKSSIIDIATLILLSRESGHLEFLADLAEIEDLIFSTYFTEVQPNRKPQLCFLLDKETVTIEMAKLILSSVSLRRTKRIENVLQVLDIIHTYKEHYKLQFLDKHHIRNSNETNTDEDLRF